MNGKGGLILSLAFMGIVVYGVRPALATSFSLAESDISKFAGETTVKGAVIILRNNANKKVMELQVSKNFALQP